MNQRNKANSREAKLLYEFAMQISQLGLHQEPRPQLASLLLAIFGVESIAIFDADLDGRARNRLHAAGAADRRA